MLRAMAPLIALVPVTAAFADGVDCTAPAGPVAQAICNDAGLSEIEMEMSRVYGLALASAGDAATALETAQADWRASLQTCQEADTPIAQCLTARYATRLHDLRAGSSAFADDGEGASLGPFAYACPGIEGSVSAMFFNTGETGVSLRWDDVSLVLPRTRSASGSRYAGDGEGGAYVFWIQGREATMTLPDGADRACIEAPR